MALLLYREVSMWSSCQETLATSPLTMDDLLAKGGSNIFRPDLEEQRKRIRAQS